MLLDTSASVSAAVVIALLEKADRLLSDFDAITLLADRGFPSTELLGWFEGRHRWGYGMRLRADTWIQGAGAPLGCEVRKLQLHRGQYRGPRGVRLWADGCRRANLVLASPTGLPIEEPWYLVSNLDPSLDLVWTYSDRFCCEQLFRDQKSGIRREPQRPTPAGGSPLETRDERSADRPELAAAVREPSRYRLLAWKPIPLRQLEPCIPSRGAYRRRKQPWFTSVDLPLQPRHSAPLAVA